MRKKFTVFLIITFVFSLISVKPFSLDEGSIATAFYHQKLLSFLDGETTYKYIEELTSDQYWGRQPGSSGADLAASFIGNTYKTFSLSSFSSSDYFQSFPISFYAIKGKPEIKITKLDSSQVFLNNSVELNLVWGNGETEGELLFLGYGVNDPKSGYNDFSGLDLKDKIAIINISLPSFLTLDASEFQLTSRIQKLESLGVKGVLVIDSATISARHKNWYKLFYKPINIPTFYVKPAFIDKILAEVQETTSTVYSKIIQAKKPFSFSLKSKAHLKIPSESDKNGAAKNVIGFIEGEDNTKSVLITAHYDHLGIDTNGEMLRGANDNASGTSIILEIAKIFSLCNIKPEYNIIFIAFSGEEEGLLGSKYFTEHPLVPLKGIIAVLNLDMVGYGDKKLTLYSDSSFNSLYGAVKSASSMLSIPIYEGGVSRGSDHYPFHELNIPNLLFLWEGTDKTTWKTYHLPADVISTIQKEHLKDTAQVTALTTLMLNPSNYLYAGKSFDESISLNFLLSGFTTPDSTVTVNNENVTLSQTGEFSKTFELKEGVNKFLIQSKGKNSTVTFKKEVSYKKEEIALFLDSEIPEITNNKILNIKGTVKGEALSINKNSILIDKEGRFAANIELKEGENILEINVSGFGSTKTFNYKVILDTTPPLIELEKIPAKTKENLIKIKGKTEDGVVIKINDKKVLLNPDFTFSYDLMLSKGVNKIKIEAEDKALNRSVLFKEVYKFEVVTFIFKLNSKNYSINSEEKIMDVEPILRDGRTYIPIRFLIEGLNGEISYDANTKKVTIKALSKTIELTIGKNEALVDSKSTLLDPLNLKIVPFIQNGRTYIPLRFVSEALGGTVNFDSLTKSITILFEI